MKIVKSKEYVEIERTYAEEVVVSRKAGEDGKYGGSKGKPLWGWRGSIGAADAVVATPIVAASSMMSAPYNVSNSN